MGQLHSTCTAPPQRLDALVDRLSSVAADPFPIFVLFASVEHPVLQRLIHLERVLSDAIAGQRKLGAARRLERVRHGGEGRHHNTKDNADWTKTKQGLTPLVHDTWLTNGRHATLHAALPRSPASLNASLMCLVPSLTFLGQGFHFCCFGGWFPAAFHFRSVERYKLHVKAKFEMYAWLARLVSRMASSDCFSLLMPGRSHCRCKG
jgi:hypothetical protein